MQKELTEREKRLSENDKLHLLRGIARSLRNSTPKSYT